MKKRLLLLSCLLVLILGTSCICSAKVKTLKIGNKKFNTSIQVGDKLKLKLKKLNGKKIQWKSSNKSVASINSKGCIKAKKLGRTTITVINGKVKIKGKVKVVKKNNKESAVINNVEITATPVLIPTEQPVSRVTEAPLVVTPTAEPTVKPTATPKKCFLPSPTPPYVDKDTYLSLQLDEEVITKDTKILSGTITICPEQIIEVYVNDENINTFRCNYYKDRFEIDVDFSKYNVGDKVKLVLSFIGKTKTGVNVYNNYLTKIYEIMSEQ